MTSDEAWSAQVSTPSVLLVDVTLTFSASLLFHKVERFSE